MVEAQRRVGEQGSTERRYSILSLPGDARAFGAAVRSHWGVEHGLALGARRFTLSRDSPGEFSHMFTKLPAHVEQINRVDPFFAQLYTYERSTFGLSKISSAQ